jgi:hypothetical protein
MTKTAFHPAHKIRGGAHSFAINDDGTEVQLAFQNGSAVVVISGSDASELRDWLNSAELRSQAEADALKAAPAS